MTGNGNATARADVHALLGPFVLDALDDLERVAFERHLEGCDTCRADVADLQTAAARLAEPAALAPPAGLRERVLTAAGQSRQLPPDGARSPGRPQTAATRTWRRRALIAAAAAVVAIVAGAISITFMNRQLDDERQTAAGVAAVLAAPDAQVNSENIAGGGRASVIYSDERGEAVVVLDDLPQLSSDETYQLWYIDDPEAQVIRSAGVIGSSVDTAPHLLTELDDAQLVALSIEPSGGSDQPTTAPLTFVPVT